MMLARALNTAWMWHGRAEARAFDAATRHVRETQAELLLSLVRANAHCQYGRRYGFDGIRSVRDYQERVPLVTYRELTPWIEAIAAGQQQVLTAEPVLMFEPTGGSSGGAKLIPYTATLRRQYQRAIACWIGNALRHYPAARNGPAYWSVSPAVQRGQVTAGRVPIGFDADCDYLAGWQRRVAKHVLLPPRDVSRLTNVEDFRYATLACLLAAPSLAIVSVWSPTFLTALLEGLAPWGEAICRDLADGTLRLPVPADEAASWRLPWRRDRARARDLANILSGNGTRAEQLARCWPHLGLLSCWTDAAAGLYVPTLQSLFPDVPIQPKGLLATEGVVSFPQFGQPGAALAVRSHFFEFLPAAAANDRVPADEYRLADELEIGGRYCVVLSTGGGLYRYDLGDLVECVGRLNQCPLVRFLGRTSAVSDLVGEKLHEQHVERTLNQVCARFQLHPELMLMLPVLGEQPRYRVLLAIPWEAGPTPSATDLAVAIDASLCENPQYHYARGLQQLHPLEVCLVRLPRGEAWRRYESQCLARGQKAGDIKPAVLDNWPGWLEVFPMLTCES